MWEMDGAGTQLNVGSRGTDPHRSIEMNMRQNGYNTNSDMFGYPENHYTVPMQAIEEIQLVRGSAALQFGPQFGGMMNYKIKEGDSTKPLRGKLNKQPGTIISLTLIMPLAAQKANLIIMLFMIIGMVTDGETMQNSITMLTTFI